MIRRLQTLAQLKTSDPNITTALAAVQREFDNVYRNIDQTKVTVVAGSGLTLSGQELGADVASATKLGMLSAADWVRFNDAALAQAGGISQAERTLWNNTASIVSLGSASWDAAYAHALDVTGNVHGATSANTANMIVRRDGSGAFSAGTITSVNLILDGSNNRLYASNTNGAIDIRANGTGEYAIGYNTGASAGDFRWYAGTTTPKIKGAYTGGSGADLSVYNDDTTAIVVSGINKRIYFPVGGTELRGTSWVATTAAQTLSVQSNGGKFWVSRYSDNAELFSVLDSNGNTYIAGTLTLVGTSGILKSSAGVVSGSAALNDLSDVNAGAPADGDALTWDSGTSKWVAVAGSGTIGGSGTNHRIPVFTPDGTHLGDSMVEFDKGVTDSILTLHPATTAEITTDSGGGLHIHPGLDNTATGFDLYLNGGIGGTPGYVIMARTIGGVTNGHVLIGTNGDITAGDLLQVNGGTYTATLKLGTLAGFAFGTAGAIAANTRLSDSGSTLEYSASAIGGGITAQVTNSAARTANNNATLALSLSGNAQKIYQFVHTQVSNADNDSQLTLTLPDASTSITFKRDKSVQFAGTVTIGALSGVLKASAGVVSGSAALNDLSDLNAGAPNNNDVLTWNSGTSKWIAQAPTGGGTIGGSGTVGTVAKFVTNTTTIGNSLIIETSNTETVTASASGGAVTSGVSNTAAKAANNVAAFSLNLTDNTQASYIWKHLQNSTTANDSDLRLYVPDGTLALTVNRSKQFVFAGAVFVGTANLYGLSTAGGQLSIYSTSHATKGNTNIDTYFSYYGARAQLVLSTSAVSPSYSQLYVNATAGSLALLSYNADNNVITFDADWSNGNWVARHTSAFGIEKSGAYLKFKGDSSLTNGNTFTPTVRAQMAPGGTWTFGGTASPTTNITIDNIGSYGSRKTDVASATNLTDVSTASSLIRITGSTATALHGFASPADGKILILINACSQNVTIKNQSATESTAANRIIAATGADHIVGPNDGAAFVYDSGQSRWVQWA